MAETLSLRVRRIGEPARRCVGAAAVLGNEFDADLVSEVLDDPEAAHALEVAAAMGLLIEVRDRPGRYRFAHTLMERFVYRDLGSARRRELHRRTALVMEARLEEGRWPLTELARHWLAAGGADSARALRFAILAGDEALRQLAPEEARRWYGASLALLDRQPDPNHSARSDLLIRRGEAERQAGDHQFRETLLEAAELAQNAGDERGLVRAALANTRGMQSETGIVDEARIAALDAALQVVGDRDPPERARLLAIEGAELMYSGQWERRVGLSDEALAIARELGEPEVLTMVLNMRFVTLLAPETYDERRANAAEAVGAVERLADPLARFFAYHWSGYAAMEAGDIPAVRSWVARERQIAERYRQPTALWLAHADEANLAIVSGRLDVADRLASAALEIGSQSEPDALACYAAQRTAIAFESGQLGEAVPLLEQAVEANPGVPGFRATLALALSEDLRLEPARELLEREAASGFRELPYDVTWLSVACIYAHIASRIGAVASAEALYPLLEPWVEQIAFPAFGVWGPVSLYLGALAALLGEIEAARRHLSDAAATARRAGAPIWEARVARQLAKLPGNES